MLQNLFEFDLSKVKKILGENKKITFVNVGNTAAKSFLLSKLIDQTDPKGCFFWGSREEKADQLKPCLSLFAEGDIHIIEPEMKLLDFYKLSKTLEQKSQKKAQVYLFDEIDRIHDPLFPSSETVKSQTIKIKKGESLKIYSFFDKLEKIGFNPALNETIERGEFVRKGESLLVFPTDASECLRINLMGDEIEELEFWDQKTKSQKTIQSIEILPNKYNPKDLTESILGLLQKNKKLNFILDDLDDINSEEFQSEKGTQMKFTAFPQEEDDFLHLNFFSLLPFYTVFDFISDIKERLRRGVDIVIHTKRMKEVEAILADHNIMYTEDLKEKHISTVRIHKIKEDQFLPHSFQNSDLGILYLTDREIFQFKRNSRHQKNITGMNMDLMNSLKKGDYVVHLDHGIAQFNGICQRELHEDEFREYLELQYAERDKLFVPVEFAEKISKYIGEDSPTLTRLGGESWKRTQKKIKKETEKIAKDLLKLYASREIAKGNKMKPDSDLMIDFCESFPYEPTPGQRDSWEDVRIDMESNKPMDRLVCGDVGFGKTEIAMRAAFKAFCSGKQTVIMAPITILAEQHYQSFLKRTKGKNYGVNIALISRFQTAAEQKKIIRDINLGAIDIIIGTHRLLSDDIKFKNLGVLIIDEEQRFGVQQKERLKKMKTGVDMLTLTATPIPRTLNMSLNKLKDISVITTPPPGRLPVVTEVRKHSLPLIRESILKEIERGGQVYFLHNQVRTIESQVEQLRNLVPEAKFIVAHGQLPTHELEKRINAFKKGEADVLVASTIIENGIDLPNANTLFVNYADKFGLSQLYQLRGRVGRSKTQAYAYFLYHGQKLSLDSRKRLRAIVEASDLGAGFQISIRDLEIRGAGEVLGVSQSGAVKDAGVSHFVRMLNKTVEEMKSGEHTDEEEENVTVEVPLSAYIPPHYIPNTNEKIQVYQQLAGANSLEVLQELKKEIEEDYGQPPIEVENLIQVLKFKILSKKAHLSGFRIQKKSHKEYEIKLLMGKKFSPIQLGEFLQKYKGWNLTAKSIHRSFDRLPISWTKDLTQMLSLLLPPENK